MQDVLLSLLMGSVVGFLFAIFKLPVPAPATFAGVMGIVGLFLGFILGRLFRANMF